MQLVYSLQSYPEDEYFGFERLENSKLFLKLAIAMAKKQGYSVALYTDSTLLEEFTPLVDNIYQLTGRYKIWSQPKFEAIARHQGEFLHIDHDLFMTDKLNIPPDGDIIIDYVEKSLYEEYYKENIELLESYGVKDIFPEWQTHYTGALNIGVLGFRNDEIKKLYLDRYHKLLNFIQDKTLVGVISMVVGEWSLACIANYHDLNVVEMNKHNNYLHMYSKRKHLPAFVEFAKAYYERNFTTD